MGIYPKQLALPYLWTMAELIRLKTFADSRGALTVLQNEIPFQPLRTYYIYGVPSPDIVRGGHRHHKATQALICIHGSCEIYVHNGIEETCFTLNKADQCLILQPEDWHTMQKFTQDAILLVFASTPYDVIS